MKLWYQNVSNIDARPEYKAALTKYVNGIADPGTVIDCYGSPTGLGGEEFNSIRYFDASWVLTNAIKAERNGYDAFIIGNTLDATLQETRELVNIPVIGHLETALFLISTMAKSFAIVTANNKLASYREDLIARYGYKDRLVYSIGLDVEVQMYEKLYTDKKFEDARIEKLLEHCRKAVAAGAELIYVLPASMYLRLEKRGIKEVDGAPIFNSIPGVIKMAELMVKYHQITGMFISRKLTYALPPRELVSQLIARHNLPIP